jgi:hypothetical protein
MQAMVAQALRRMDPAALLLLPAGLLLGALTGVDSKLGAGALFAVAALALAWLAPVAHLTLLITLTSIVPFSILNAYSIGGGTGSPGLAATDLLLATGLSRALWLLAQDRLPPRQVALFLGTVLFVVIVALQGLHGILAGNAVNSAGTETRELLGFGSAAIALPILNDPAGRRRLMTALLIVGLALGLWGMAQWTLNLSYGATNDVGVRAGVAETTGGRGQLYGGLFGFPIAVVVGFAALLAGGRLRPRTRLAVVALVALNGIAVLLTYERTFWLVTAVACAYVALRAGRPHRARALLAAPLVLVLVLVPLTLLEPSAVTAAGQRLLSLGGYANDPAIDYRLRESRAVLDRIRAAPLDGSGLGATIYWGRPQVQVAPAEFTFSHNGFLRIAWKLGIPVALLFFAGLTAAATARGPVPGSPLVGAFVLGAQGALVALVLVNVTFPSVTALSITAVLGVLVAASALRRPTTHGSTQHGAPPAALRARRSPVSPA